MSNKKKIIVELDSFNGMIKLIKELRRANELLNKQIREYNKNFVENKKNE